LANSDKPPPRIFITAAHKNHPGIFIIKAHKRETGKGKTGITGILLISLFAGIKLIPVIRGI
jgi:hypothetical protein